MQAVAESIDSAQGIRRAALEAFYEYGYHGTSVRDIAKRAGLSVAALYHHFPSKQLILVELVNGLMDGLIEAIEEAVKQAPGDAPSRLAAVVRTHVLFHIEHQAEGFVGNAELRSLNPTDRAVVVDKRNREQRLFDRIIRDGVATGDFAVTRPLEASRGIQQMATAVLSWYQPDDALSPEEVADIYVELAWNLVCYRPAPT